MHLRSFFVVGYFWNFCMHIWLLERFPLPPIAIKFTTEATRDFKLPRTNDPYYTQVWVYFSWKSKQVVLFL